MSEDKTVHNQEVDILGGDLDEQELDKHIEEDSNRGNETRDIWGWRYFLEGFSDIGS